LSRQLAVAFAPIADGSVVDAEQSGHLCQLHWLVKVLQEKALFFRPPGSGNWATRQSREQTPACAACVSGIGRVAARTGLQSDARALAVRAVRWHRYIAL
jgi:hypothetical protein